MDAEGNRKFSRANSGLVFESFQLLDPTTAPVLIIVASDASFHGNVTQHPLFCEYLHCYESSLITEFYFQTVPSTCTNQNDPKPLLGFHLLGCQLISKPWRQTDHQKASMAMQHAGLGWNTRPISCIQRLGCQNSGRSGLALGRSSTSTIKDLCGSSGGRSSSAG